MERRIITEASGRSKEAIRQFLADTTTRKYDPKENMKGLSYSCMFGGTLLFLGGVVAVFGFDQPSEPFSLVWGLLVGGWCIAMVGIAIHILRFFRMINKGE